MRQVVGFGDRSTERGTFGGEFGAPNCNNGDFTAYVCDSAAMRPSSQISLGKLVAMGTPSSINQHCGNCIDATHRRRRLQTERLD